jgi:ABC-2 type transport system permease protein
MTTSFRALVSKDLQIFFADRRAVLMSFVAPIVIASFFGYIFGGQGGQTTASRIPVLTVDRDGSAISREIVAGLTADEALDVKPSSLDAARAAVRKGKAIVAILIPQGFGTDAGRALFGAANKPELGALYDPSHATELAMVQGMLAGSVMEAVGSQVGARVRLAMPYSIRQEAVTSGQDVAYNGYAHAFGGMGVQFILFMGIEAGLSILLQRQRGLWSRLRAAPLSRGALLGSRAVSAGLIAMLILLVLFGFARLVFGVRIEGSLAGFLGVCAAFSLMTATFGLLIAALGKTPEATRGLAIFATLVMVMLGGSWVPTFVFPQWLQNLTVAVPTRWAMDGLDAMTWRGLGLAASIAPIGVLLLFSLFFGVIAVMRFRWEADG